MVRRTSGRTEALHLLHEEWQQCALILNRGLGHRIEIGLVGRATALRHHHEAVFLALGSLDVDLSRQVALGVHFLIHRERRILRVAQVILRIGVVDATRQGFLLIEVGPHALTLFTVDDGRTRVLAEGQHTLDGRLGIAQQRQGHILVVVGSLGVVEDSGHLLVVLAAKAELHIVESLLSQQRQGFLAHLENFLAFELTCAYTLFGKQPVFGVIGSKLKHWSILEINWFCHNSKYNNV